MDGTKHCKITTFSPYPISKAENIAAGGNTNRFKQCLRKERIAQIYKGFIQLLQGFLQIPHTFKIEVQF